MREFEQDALVAECSISSSNSRSVKRVLAMSEGASFFNMLTNGD